MYCGKCGKQLPDEYEFCMNCGSKIEKNYNIDNNNEEKIKQELNKSKNRKVIIICIAIFILLGSVAMYFNFFRTQLIEGTYTSGVNDEYMKFTPDEGKTDEGNCDVYILNTSSGKKSILSSEPYIIKDGTLMTKAKIFPSDRSTLSYIIYKDYLIRTESVLDGKIPEGERFDAILKYDNGHSFTFNKDGTYSIETGFILNEGTYEREGNVITCDFGDGDNKKICIWYNNKFYSVAYQKVSE